MKIEKDLYEDKETINQADHVDIKNNVQQKIRDETSKDNILQKLFSLRGWPERRH